jgi:hypothetical protein
MKLFFTFLILVLFVACKDDEQEKIDVYQIRTIGLLSTSEYTIGKIIELNDNKEWYKFGDRNILISCKAKIKAGIDLSKIGDKDIITNGSSITIYLPYPEILSFDMDPNTIKTEMEDVNGFRTSFSQDEKNEILALGEKDIKAKMGKTNILKNAKTNAEIFIKNFYKELAYTDIHVEFKKSYTEEISAH